MHWADSSPVLPAPAVSPFSNSFLTLSYKPTPSLSGPFLCHHNYEEPLSLSTSPLSLFPPLWWGCWLCASESWWCPASDVLGWGMTTEGRYQYESLSSMSEVILLFSLIILWLSMGKLRSSCWLLMCSIVLSSVPSDWLWQCHLCSQHRWPHHNPKCLLTDSTIIPEVSGVVIHLDWQPVKYGW